MRKALRLFAPLASLFLLSCQPNDPYRPEEHDKNILFSSFSGEPKHLDPARSYSEDEYNFITQIYEPPLQYHYLKRPYELIPLTTTTVPEPQYFDKDGKALPADAPPENVAKVVYAIKLRGDVQYQDHPCFARNADETYRWHLGPNDDFPKIDHPDELSGKDTRKLRAEDYAYQLKRLAHPLLQCPIFGLLADYVDGLGDFQATLNKEVERIRAERRTAAGPLYNQEADERTNPIYLDLRKYDFPGLQVVDESTLRITLVKPYPQFKYWLAMPFFAPIPWEADRFFTQPAAARQNIALDRFPIGTGPYTLAVNEPNFRMTLRRNSHFHPETYPTDGEPGDEKEGFLQDKGKALPFVDEAIYVLEKEGVPRWNKFLQGYYDASGVGGDVFDQAVQLGSGGQMNLTDEMRTHNIRLVSEVAPSTMYYAFNMLDDVVGGLDEKKKKLRQALSIAFDVEEYIQIFMNGQGFAAQGPIPPGLFGYQEGKEGFNSTVYDWDEKEKKPKRKSIEEAKKLLAEAGYPEGRDAEGKPLIIYFDTTGRGAGSKAFLDWMRKQFGKLNVQLQIRSTDYNQFQEKASKGNWQFMGWGWNADYPDPENFLFLLDESQGKVKAGGENAANYSNPRYNELFTRVKAMSNSPERLELIKQMNRIAREDAPWIWGNHPVDFSLYHQWYFNAKPSSFGGNSLKYRRVDTALREKCQKEWNQPVTWPLWALLGLLVLCSIPASLTIYRREKEGAHA
ncbi:MAG: ABC transporter substrate-binding protein [Planctomycetes bacterium]|nr:ABC transporter substrate-binding protein [Planctomycetota bacterium]